MKKALFVCLLLSNLAFSQNDLEFKPGYYVINSNAEYSFQSIPNELCQAINQLATPINIVDIKIVAPWEYEQIEEGFQIENEGSAFENVFIRKHQSYFSEDEPPIYFLVYLIYGEKDFSYLDILSDLSINKGELVKLDEFVNDVYIGHTINGAKVFIKGKNSVSKTQDGVGYCQLQESIDFIDGSVINAGTNYWVISQNIANSTVRIQLQDGKSLDVPQSKISLTSAIVKREIQASNFKKVE